MMRVAIVLAGCAASACSVGPLDLTGKQCPCADGWTCDLGTNTCVGGPSDAPVVADARIDAPPGTPDAPPDARSPDARVDATPGTTCLGAPGAELLFDDFPDLIGWSTSGGTWSAVASEAIQSNISTALAYAFPAGTSSFTDYRVTIEARRVAGTGLIQAASRIQAGDDGQYACGWDADSGQFSIVWQRTNGNLGGTIASMTIDTTGIPGYDPAGVFTIEFQAVGTQLSCCIREVPGSMLAHTDNRYLSGSPGIRTSLASVAFGTFRVNSP